jgi:hypothetical protein
MLLRCRSLILLSVAQWLAVAASSAAAEEAAPALVVDYPVAEEFVAPIEAFFEDVASTMGRVGRRTFRHQSNGGYGLPVVDRVGDQNLIHLGADVGWYRVCDP